MTDYLNLSALRFQIRLRPENFKDKFVEMQSKQFSYLFHETYDYAEWFDDLANHIYEENKDYIYRVRLEELEFRVNRAFKLAGYYG